MIKLLALALISVSAVAQTNVVEQGAKEYGGIELTLGGSGIKDKETSEFGLDFSISTNPFKHVPQVWVGVAQSLFWASSSFDGSTDVFADWNTHIYKDLYLNTGWSVGSVYDKHSHIWRTGPEVTLQYYTSDNAFIYLGANYDIVSEGNNGFRYGFGIGLAF